MTGLDRGSTIWKKILYSLAPSILADSSRDSGIALKLVTKMIAL